MQCACMRFCTGFVICISKREHYLVCSNSLCGVQVPRALPLLLKWGNRNARRRMELGSLH